MLRAALQADPTDRRLTALLGESLYERGRFDEAEPHLRRGAEADPRCLLPLARAVLSRGDSVEYRALLELAVTRDVYGSHILLGNVLAQTGDRGAAAHLYRHGVASGDSHSAFNLGVHHYENDEFEQARAMFAEARRGGDLTRSPFDGDPQPGGNRGA